MVYVIHNGEAEEASNSLQGVRRYRRRCSLVPSFPVALGVLESYEFIVSLHATLFVLEVMYVGYLLLPLSACTPKTGSSVRLVHLYLRLPIAMYLSIPVYVCISISFLRDLLHSSRCTDSYI